MKLRRPTAPTSKGGFTLIITILLMAFVVLLVVSMASLTRVEIQIAANSQAVGRAQQNALMALNVAIGQLQKEAGLDQKITARAEILDSNAATTAIDSVCMPYLTGVWTTGKASPDILTSIETGSPQRQTTFGGLTPTAAQKNTAAKWLVSTPKASDTLDPITGKLNGTTTLTVSDTLTAAVATQSGLTGNTTSGYTAVLLGKDIGCKDPTLAHHATNNPGYQVAAPLVDIKATVPGLGSNQTIGKYAYWVSDEGVKAKVNLKDSTLALNSSTQVAQNALHFSAPQATAGHKAFLNITGTTVNEDFRTIANKVLVPNSLGLIPSVSGNASATSLSFANIKTVLPDITTYSYGVLADVRNGGLKKDLTAAFETNTEYAKLNSNGYKNVYDLTSDSIPLKVQSGSPAANSYSASNPTFNTGLKWSSLYWFYNLYKAAAPADPISNVSNGSAPSGLGDPQNPNVMPARMESWRNQAAAATSTSGSIASMGALSPTVIGYQNDITLVAIPTNSPTNSKFKLYVRYYPKLILHNPFAVSIGGAGFDIGKAFGSGAGQIWWKLRITDPLPAITFQTYDVLLNPAKSDGYVVLQINDPGFPAMKPGEIRVYGMGTDLQIPTQAGTSTSTPPSSTSLASNNKGILSSSNYTAGKAIYSELLVYDSASKTHSPITSDIVLNSTITRLNIGNDTTYLSTTSITNNGFSWTSLPFTSAWPNAMTAAMINTSGGTTVKVYNTSNVDSGAPLYEGPLYAGQLPTAPSALTVTDSMPETSLHIVRLRRKGLRAANNDPTISTNDRDANYTATTGRSFPICHGNNGGYNPFYETNLSVMNTIERYVDSSSTTYSPKAATVCVNGDTGTRATSWGQYSAGNNSTLDPITSNPTRIVLSDVPIQPLTSLGQFMHIKPWYFYARYVDEPFGSMFIGGSVCSPTVPTTQTFFAQSPIISADDSYLANQVLFDSYFFSTVPPSSKPSGTTWPTTWDTFNAANQGITLTDTSIPFLNSRIIPNPVAGTITLSDLRAMEKAAGKLLLNGAFNINSTSVAAWKALLCSLSGNDIRMWDATGQTYKNFTNLNCPIPRFWSATSNGNVNTPWCAVRDLTDDQVTDLATKIVQEVKTRGPFLNMADFLNRRLGAATSDLSRAGALQAAIDKTSPDINSTAKAAGETTDLTNFNSTNGFWQDGKAGRSDNLKDASSTAGTKFNTALGIPGYLMQQDLVQAFSPVMAARSDTFVIRTYGESINPAINATESNAYCEAVVQRLPEWVNTTDAAELYPPTKSDNLSFGRRFKIVSFRWLTASDL